MLHTKYRPCARRIIVAFACSPPAYFVCVCVGGGEVTVFITMCVSLCELLCVYVGVTVFVNLCVCVFVCVYVCMRVLCVYE